MFFIDQAVKVVKRMDFLRDRECVKTAFQTQSKTHPKEAGEEVAMLLGRLRLYGGHSDPYLNDCRLSLLLGSMEGEMGT